MAHGTTTTLVLGCRCIDLNSKLDGGIIFAIATRGRGRIVRSHRIARRVSTIAILVDPVTFNLFGTGVYPCATVIAVHQGLVKGGLTVIVAVFVD
jgi:hypothetical protein